MHFRGLVHVLEHPHDSKHGRGIYGFAQRLVVEADVAAGDGNFQFLASLRDPIDRLRELPHDVRLFGIAEVQAIRCSHRSGSRARHFARRLRDRVHRAQPRIQMAPAPIPIQRHRKPALRALNANHARVARSRRFNRVGLHHVVVLLPHPTFAANIRACQQLLQIRSEVDGPADFDLFRHLARHWRFPSRQRAFVYRGVVSQRRIRNLRHNFAVLQHAQRVAARNPPDLDRVEPPLFENAEDLVLASFLRHQQHALLRLAEHDLVRSHASLTLRNAVQFDFDAHTAAPAHLAGRTRQARSAHILNANDRAGLHGFKAGFEQQFFQKGIADLHVGPLRFRGFAELFAGHGRAVYAVASSLRAHIDHRIAFAYGPRVEDFIFPYQAQSETVHQRISGVAGLELRFAAQVRHAETVAVGCNSADHALKYGMILVEFFLGCCAVRGRVARTHTDRPEPQRIHDRDRSCAHGEDIPQNSTYARGRALKGFDERGVIVRFDLEGAGPAVANVDDAGVLARSLQYEFAARGQAFQMHTRRLIGAVLAPHHAEDAELSEGRLALAEKSLDLLVLIGREAMLPESLRRKGRGQRGGHGKSFYCRIAGRGRIEPPERAVETTFQPLLLRFC